MKISNKRRYVIATIKSWNIKEARRFISNNPDLEVLLMTDRKELTYQQIKEFNPRYIFFPHWSWIIPEKIYKNYECIVFHMTDLPFGRGGSPLQNLIARGVYETKLTAIKVVKEIDAGSIYLKRNLILKGSATQIFKRGSKIIFGDMFPYIIKNKLLPISQKGEIVKFKRRTPKESDIANLRSKRKVYDYIRMLDGEGYPLAFIETSNLRVEFFNAKLGKNSILANAKISVKENR